MISTAPPFVLRLSKDERRVFQQNQKCSITSADVRQVIGLISDTHGLLRPEAVSVLAGVELIIHSGDIGKPMVLAELKKIAPVAAIKGNVDTGDWARRIPNCRRVIVGEHGLYVIHNVHELEFDPAKRNIRVIVSGHSHKPMIAEKDGVLFVNPGSAGPRRFKLPVAVGKVFVDGPKVRAEIVELSV
jgi:putative phosphoesterase